jgi:glyoxylase-like metal-dependent hydrolase (beta-lactamase superfamily II)
MPAGCVNGLPAPSRLKRPQQHRPATETIAGIAAGAATDHGQAMRFPALLVAGLASSVVVAWAQRDFSKVEIKATPVAGTVFMLEGAGGNIGVSAGPDGVLIVDDQFAPLAAKIAAKVKELNPAAPRFLLNTHWHGDHTGGNAFFGEKGANIVAHANVRKRLADKADSKPAELPVLTYEQGASVHFNGEEIRVIALGPGHTDGDSLVWFSGAKVLHMGDQFFAGKVPFIDLGSGGDVAGYLANVDRALALVPADAKVIPGHGPLASVADLKAFRDMLVETTGVVKQALAAGKTLEQVKAAGLPEKWKDWGTGFINTSRWLEICFNSLAKK